MLTPPGAGRHRAVRGFVPAGGRPWAFSRPVSTTSVFTSSRVFGTMSVFFSCDSGSFFSTKTITAGVPASLPPQTLFPPPPPPTLAPPRGHPPQFPPPPPAPAPLPSPPPP